MSKDYKLNRNIYKVYSSGQQDPTDSACSKSESTSSNLFQFVTIKVKPCNYMGRKAAALTIFEATEKIQNRLAKLEKRERHLNQQ